MIDIIYEDNAILVCIKPRGILSQADSGGKQNMIALLSEHTGGEVYPIHRLDKEVGGVMVYAKTKSAAAQLSKQVAEHTFVKEYIALINGTPSEKKGEMRDYLFKDSKRNKSYVVNRVRKGVKEALLEYEVLSTESDYTRVAVQLHTGRTHQIRVQFASRKMPLVGDKKYGAKDNFNILALWSHKISFINPEKGEAQCFCANPDF